MTRTLLNYSEKLYPLKSLSHLEIFFLRTNYEKKKII